MGKVDSESFPPRIHVIMAREARKAVVFRRGPSKQVATFLWDTTTDKFGLGQWLKGRIYERRCDLSPDGSHLIYFAMNGKRHTETQGSWTAISKTPFLKAIDLLAKGDCWEGGGLFIAPDRYWLNDGRIGAEHRVLRKSSLVQDTRHSRIGEFGSECLGVYYPRLIRDGWRLIERKEIAQWNSQSCFEKTLLDGWILRKIAHEQVGPPTGKGCYWDEHELENDRSGLKIRCPEWEWAEWDQNSLVWSEAGKIFRSRISDTGLQDQASCLQDFAPYTFSQIEAPY